MPVQRCPRALVRESPEVLELLPYFFEYCASIEGGGGPVWPDNRGTYYQPVKLVQAFRLLMAERLRLRPKSPEADKDAK
jgi:hypothetical protein